MKTQFRTKTLLGHELPKHWMCIGPYGPDGFAYRTILDQLQVIETRGTHDGHEWLHVSMSREGRIPSYEDMTQVKRIFVGDDRMAVQIFPAKERHINIHNYCLHLWCPLDYEPLPDFGKFGTI